MKTFPTLMVVILMTFVGVRYSYLTFMGEIKPVITTWLLLSLATSIGLWTYMKSEQKKKDYLANIANTMDVIICSSIFLFILFFGSRPNGGMFRSFDIICIAISVLILFYFFWKRNGVKSNIAINAVIAVAYLPTLVFLWTADQNTESISVWSVVLIAQVFALIEPIRKRDFLATLYAGRAFVIVAVMILLMIRLEIT